MAGVDQPRRYVDPFIAGLTAQAPSVREMVAVRGRALPGASEVLRGLQGRAHQSVLTGNIRPVAEVKLAAVGLRDGLDLCIGAYGDDHEIRAELVPVARRRAAAVHGKSPADFAGAATVVIGDTPLDIEAALAAGARAIGVATGGYTASELTAAGADAVLPDLTDTDAVLQALLALYPSRPLAGTGLPSSVAVFRLPSFGCRLSVAVFRLPSFGCRLRLPSLLADLPRPRRPRRSASTA
jgi:phosphoglycolate phosphatase